MNIIPIDKEPEPTYDELREKLFQLECSSSMFHDTIRDFIEETLGSIKAANMLHCEGNTQAAFKRHLYPLEGEINKMLEWIKNLEGRT